jgi:hypothetical protein
MHHRVSHARPFFSCRNFPLYNFGFLISLVACLYNKGGVILYSFSMYYPLLLFFERHCQACWAGCLFTYRLIMVFAKLYSEWNLHLHHDLPIAVVSNQEVGIATFPNKHIL